jgi:hypothetical protein
LGLVQEQYIRVLNQRVGEERSGLLSARKLADEPIGRHGQIDCIHNLADPAGQIGRQYFKGYSKILFRCQVKVFARHCLASRADARAFGGKNMAGFRLDLPFDESEQRALARAILPHQCNFGIFSHAETNLIENELFVPVFKIYLVKSQDYFFGHKNFNILSMK